MKHAGICDQDHLNQLIVNNTKFKSFSIVDCEINTFSFLPGVLHLTQLNLCLSTKRKGM